MAKRRPQTIVDLETIWRERLALEASGEKAARRECQSALRKLTPIGVQN